MFCLEGEAEEKAEVAGEPMLEAVDDIRLSGGGAIAAAIVI